MGLFVDLANDAAVSVPPSNAFLDGQNLNGLLPNHRQSPYAVRVPSRGKNIQLYPRFWPSIWARFNSEVFALRYGHGIDWPCRQSSGEKPPSCDGPAVRCTSFLLSDPSV